MAFTLAATLRTSACIFSKAMVVSAARHGNKASHHVRTGSVACSPGGRNAFSFTPACFITSDAFLKRLATDKAAEAEADGSLHQYQVSVPADSGEQLSLLLRHPNQPEDSKILRVAVIGAPNAGKSTLSNQLLGRKVFAVSKKVHTTRSRALGVLTEDATQIILLDTPGLTTPSKVKRHGLERSLLVDPWTTVKEADFMVVMVDVAERLRYSALDFEVLRCLAQHADIPAVLVLNKVDLLKSKMRLLQITEELTCGVVGGHRLKVKRKKMAEKRPRTTTTTSWDDDAPSPELPLDEDDDTEPGGGSRAAEGRPPPGALLSAERLKALSTQRGWNGFKDVFMLSSLDREDVSRFKRYLVAAARPGDWQYHSDVLTDQSPEDVCTSIIREKLLEHLHQEVPYTMKQSVDLWQDGANGELIIAVKLYVMKDTHMKMVIGPAGQMVARMSREAEDDLSRVFLRDVKLSLSVKLKQ